MDFSQFDVDTAYVFIQNLDLQTKIFFKYMVEETNIVSGILQGKILMNRDVVYNNLVSDTNIQTK